MVAPADKPLITVLCVARSSNYHQLPGLDLWNEKRNAYNFRGTNPVICHAPCAQWSRTRNFARLDHRSKNLALFCWEIMKQNGCIFEHPAGSSFFDYVQADRKHLYSVDQSWWGFPARKRTYLYYERCKPLATPLKFELPSRTVTSLHSGDRSIMPVEFCKYLIRALTPLLVYHNSHHAPLLK